MARNPEKVISEIVRAAGGKLVSRVRLQKIAYLLDRMGVENEFSFSYYHYGPYSRELEAAVLDAQVFEGLTESFDRRASDGARFSIFEVKPSLSAYEFLTDERVRDIVKMLAKESVISLELAATACWLAFDEQVDDWREEIVRRKGSKVTDERLAHATKLLSKMSLELPSP